MKKIDRLSTIRYLVFVSAALQIVMVNAIPFMNGSSMQIPSVTNVTTFFFVATELIAISVLVYSILQMTRFTWKKVVYDFLSVPVMILCFLGILQMYCIQFGLDIPALIVPVVTLVIAFRSFMEANLEINQNKYSMWLQFPFAFLSAITSVTLVDSFTRYSLEQQLFTVELIGNAETAAMVALTVIGLLIHYRTSSLIFPLTLAWFMFSLYGDRHDTAPGFSYLILMLAVATVAIPVFINILRKANTINKLTRLKTRTKLNSE